MTYTTDRVREQTRDKLMSLKRPDESVDQLLDRIFPATDAVEGARAFSVEAAEQKMRAIYMQRIADYNREHADSHEKNLRELGHDLEAERPSFVPKKRR